MKKLFAILSLTAFLAVAVNAQTNQSAPAPKKETVKAETKSPSCCTKANAACCKSNKEAKACTPEQKAACAKASGSSAKCSHDHKKAEATETKAATPAVD